MSRNDDSTKLLACTFGFELLEAMQCASVKIYPDAMIADLEGQYTNKFCILTDVVWVTSEVQNPKVCIHKLMSFMVGTTTLNVIQIILMS